ncbi:MAG: UDP-N-acetylglucosamine--N-acetylmuramyl-(pentapeptide) pyrophosphoryl-undecaprenol N-acetylglucosamine transferase [Deferribacteraceae bacterium]|jgi:UDP-N-acetylglucosamine--N-acetylmuramyl-(pentapeptide) pyrophosphoryl-undecaprenol N-acetylglucosamine transferase|nr:UDP-N-acetylglucosamine--N-acetylmuramyl-(pentapeptide) pyrophosphoryl-undecaprenol N-acetylglucosamine transferase [Deferribacteraceae bacterium]
MKLIIAGGGTGGHLYPGIAVAERLKDKVPLLFLVSERGIEREVLSKLGYDFVEQKVSVFAGEKMFGKVKALSKLVKQSHAVSGYIKKGDKVLVLGGFAGAPAAMAGILKRNEVYIHESNSVMGTLNRWLASQAAKVFTAYSKTLHAPARSICVGNPVRSSFFGIEANTERGKNILVIGGSNGARIINQTVVKAAKTLLEDGYSITHQTGKTLEDETRALYKAELKQEYENLRVLPFIDDMAQELKWADMVAARAGSGMLFEAMAAKRPGIYIPFAAAAQNHQFHNAKYMVDSGFGRLITEDRLSAAALIKEIDKMYIELTTYGLNFAHLKIEDAAAKMIKLMGLDN